MNKFHTIYLDMDGPLANFHLEAIRAHMRAGKRYPNLHDGSEPMNLTAENLFNRWPKGKSLHHVACKDLPLDIDNFWSPEMNAFWKPIESDPLFWRNIEPMPYWKDLWALVHDYAHEVRIATTPHRHRWSYGGKRHWLELYKLDKHEPICNGEKWRMCHPDDLLIDDYEGQINKWLKECQRRYPDANGCCYQRDDGTVSKPEPVGHAILYPAVWNEQHAQWANPLPYIERLINVHLAKL